MILKPPPPKENSIPKPFSTKDYRQKPITEIINNGFFTVDRKWTVTYWNKAAERLLGVEANNILGKNLWEEFAASIPLEFYTVYYKAFQEDTSFHFEEYWGEMGTWFDVITYYCDNTLSVSFKSNNHHERFVPQEQLAQQLKILNDLYRFVTEITNDCLWEWDFQAKEMFWIDGGHKRVFGYQIENALIPQSFWESRLHPDDKLRVMMGLSKIIDSGFGSVWEEEYRFKRSNGEYAYVQDRAHIIFDDDNKAYRMIGATQDVTEKILLKNKLAEESLLKSREITNAVLTAQENERANIGKELHDNLNQILAVAKLYIQIAKMHEDKREVYLEKSCLYIGNVIEEIRRISKILAPGVNIISLFDNIKNLIHDLLATHPIKIKFQYNDIIETDLDEKLQLTIFRIVQEQINNILKYANATNATICLKREEEQLTLIISDDGEGCDDVEKKGVGIINIKSRADLYNGNVAIITNPGQGFEL